MNMAKKIQPVVFSESTEAPFEIEEIQKKISTFLTSTEEEMEDAKKEMLTMDEDDDSIAKKEAMTETSFHAARKRYQDEISRLRTNIRHLKKERQQKMKQNEPILELRKHFDLNHAEEVKLDSIQERVNSNTSHMSESYGQVALVTEWDILGETHGLRFRIMFEVLDDQQDYNGSQHCPPQEVTWHTKTLPQIIKMDVEVYRINLSPDAKKAILKFCKYKALDQCVQYLQEYASRNFK